MDFCIERWAAWAPGFSDPVSWQAWFQNPERPGIHDAPELKQLPPMQRRRVGALGRYALSAAYALQETAPADVPVIFASRYGELSRSAELLTQLAQGEALSPMSFSLSVHNAIGALSSIARGDTTSYTAVAAGDETLEAAFTEAAGLLADDVDEVLIVAYDEPVPEVWGHFEDLRALAFPRALGFRVRRRESGPGFSLTSTAAPDAPVARPAELPADLEVLRFLVRDDAVLERRVGTRRWRWVRHA